MRICSFLPGATEILFSLGLGDQIVGVTHECDYPPEAKNKPVIVRCRIDANGATGLEIDRQVREALARGQSLYTIDAVALAKAAPDIILTQALCDVCALDYGEVVKTAHSLPHPPKVLSLDPHSLDDVVDDIARVGKATEREREAAALVSLLQSRIAAVSRHAAHATSRPRVACLEWFDPLYAAGHWVPEMVTLAGGRDILGRIKEPSAKFEWEQLLELEPEIIILMACGFDLGRTRSEAKLLTRLAGWNELPAVRMGGVFAVDGSSYFSRPGPRLVDGLEFLAQIIHPELFSGRAPADAVQEISI
jgi:iron complex transport system substrate-binding protein